LWEIARRSFRRATRYRAATAAGVFTNTVFGYLRAAILVVVATTAGGAVRGYDATDLVTFAFVSQGFIMVVGIFGDRELAQRVRTGDVVIDLYRPVDLQLWWLAVWLGQAAFQTLGRGIPPVILGALVYDLRWPDPWWQWPIFLASVVLASTIGFALRFCSALTAFWLLDNRGVEQLVTMAANFFTGLLLPITLFPHWLEQVARWLPFAAMLQLPTELFLGRHHGWAIAGVLGQQLAWVAALIGAGRMLLGAATRRVVVQGG
jgi:ABC-2 type transport system permease protein